MSSHAPAQDTVATGQFATGQAAQPRVLIWSAEKIGKRDADGKLEDHGPEGRPLPLELVFGRGEQAIIALAFSIHDDGIRLATVSTDNAHTVSLWDWRVGKLLATGSGYNGQPPQVFGVVWNQFKGEVCPYRMRWGWDTHAAGWGRRTPRTTTS
jgi:hypothetical protein